MAITKIQSNAFPADISIDLADDAITAVHIADGAVQTAHIADNAVDSTKLDETDSYTVAGLTSSTSTSGYYNATTVATGYQLNGTSVLNYSGGNTIVGDLGAGVALEYGGANKIITTSTGVDVTGTVTADGLTVDTNSVDGIKFSGSSPSFVLNETDTTDLNARIASNGGNFSFQTANDAYSSFDIRLNISHSTGDISFYEDTGTIPKFFWDASAEQLFIGSTSGGGQLHVDATLQTSLQLEHDANGTKFAVDHPSGGSVDLQTYTGGAWTTPMSFKSGNVGIGTDSPSRNLHVYSSSSNADVLLEAPTAGSDARLFLKRNGSAGRSYIRFEDSSTNATWFAGLLRNTNDTFAIGQGDDFGTNTHFKIDADGYTIPTEFKPDKYRQTVGPEEITGGFVYGCATNTWHSITNVDFNSYLGGYAQGYRGVIVEVHWTSGSVANGYNHTAIVYIPGRSSNTHSTYSGGNYCSFSFGSTFSDELPVTVCHHTSCTATHTIRMRLRNSTPTVNYAPLRLEIYASTTPNSSNAKITVWRA